MATLRVLRTAKATLSRSFYLDEVETAATGSVLVSVTRLDGTPVENGEAAPDGQGGYSYTFGGRDVLDTLTVTWMVTLGGDAMVLDQDVIEVVGGFYFGLSEARDIDPKFTNTSAFPTEKLIERRTEVEDECEVICEQSFVPRFAREVLSGNGSSAIVLGHPLVRSIRSVTVAGSVMSAPAFGPDTAGVLRYGATGGYWPLGVSNVIIEYEHGHDRPPTAIVRGAKLRMKSLLLATQSPLMDRAERVMTVDQSGGTVVYGSPSAGKTGIPETDAAYAKYPSPRPGFG